MTFRRTPAAPGVRPPAHPVRVRRRCVVCRGRFTLNRRESPWARAVTCSPSCRVRLANGKRNPSNCRHCALVELYHLTRDSDIRENIEIPGGDERHPITFREFISGHRYEPWDIEPEEGAA